jgi:hypothetical protein
LQLGDGAACAGEGKVGRLLASVGGLFDLIGKPEDGLVV